MVDISAIPDDYDPIFVQTGNKYGIDPLYLKSQAYYESGLDPTFKSDGSSASGLGAFTDATAQQYNVDRNNPQSIIDAQARYNLDNYKKFGDPQKAISAYKFMLGHEF